MFGHILGSLETSNADVHEMLQIQTHAIWISVSWKNKPVSVSILAVNKETQCFSQNYSIIWLSRASQAFLRELERSDQTCPKCKTTIKLWPCKWKLVSGPRLWADEVQWRNSFFWSFESGEIHLFELINSVWSRRNNWIKISHVQNAHARYSNIKGAS